MAAPAPKAVPAEPPTLPVLPPEQMSPEQTEQWNKEMQRKQSVVIQSPPKEARHVPAAGGRRASTARRRSSVGGIGGRRRSSVGMARRRSSVGMARRRSSVGMARRRSSVGMARRRSSVGMARRRSSVGMRRPSGVVMMGEDEDLLEDDPYSSFYVVLSVVLALGNTVLAAALIYFLMFAQSGPKILKWKFARSELPEPPERPGGDGTEGRCLVVCFYDPGSSEWDPSLTLRLDRTPFTDACTHIVYSDLIFKNDGGPAVDFGRPELANKLLGHVVTAAIRSKSTLVAELRSRQQSDAATLEAAFFPGPQGALDAFTDATKNFLSTNNFVGLSLNVYNPDSGPASVGQNYLKLIKAMKNSLAAYQFKLMVTMYFIRGLSDGLDIAEIAKNVDVLVLGTHYLVPDEKKTTLPSPLYGKYPAILSWDSVIDKVLDATKSPDRVVASLSFSGSEFVVLQEIANTDLSKQGLPAAGHSQGGQHTKMKGLLAYFEICVMFRSEPWKHAVNMDGVCPVMCKDSYWVGYDNAWSIRQKVAYALQRRLAGIAVQNMGMDDWNGVCGYEMPLMKAVTREMQYCRV